MQPARSLRSSGVVYSNSSRRLASQLTAIVTATLMPRSRRAVLSFPPRKAGIRNREPEDQILQSTMPTLTIEPPLDLGACGIICHRYYSAAFLFPCHGILDRDPSPTKPPSHSCTVPFFLFFPCCLLEQSGAFFLIQSRIN